ncbi:MAG: ABC transporter family substrate-binding protein [Actinomycetota bacterium]
MFKNRAVKMMLGVAVMAGSLALPVATGASTSSVIVTLDNVPSGWNNFTSANNDFRVGQILSQIWPSPFINDSHGAFVQDKNIVSSATSKLVKGKQVVTYVVNPKAEWQDGVAVNAEDFIYIYQALSGNPAFTDKGGAPYDAAGNSGYNQIQSVVGSKPVTSGGVPFTCGPGSAGNRNAGLCPNGKTVTVTFKAGQTYPEWVGLFGLLPAHIARSIGFNTGFEDPANDPRDNVLSAGPYKLSSYNYASNTFTETKNPNWWGTPGKYDQIIFKNLASDSQGIAGLAAGDYNVFEPTTATKAMIDEASNYPDSITDSVVQGYQFEHVDFNQANTDLKKLQVRQAIAYAINRGALIAATVGQYLTTSPLDSHIFMANQPGYAKNGKAYDIGGSAAGIAKAKALLTAAGYKFNNSDNFFHKGTTSGPRLSFNFWNNGTSARTTEAQIIQGQLRQVGISMSIHVASNGTILGSGNFDMVIFAWVGSPLLSGNKDIYACDGGSNYDNYCNHAFDTAATKANVAPTTKAEAALYNAADKILWADMATLPLYQKPQYGAWTNTVGNVLVNPTQAGIVWNAQKWTVQ